MDQDSIISRLPALTSELGIPGASLAYYYKGQTVTASTGLANIPADINVDDNTIFQIGSITKVFTATLIMKLVEDGKVILDTPVSTYLPDLKIDGQAPPNCLTVRNLLNYSAGMEGDYFDDFGSGDDALEQYVAACADLKWIHKPGEIRAYNSTAYCIAGRLIEIVTGKPYNEALTDLLLRPIGLERYCFYDHEVARYRTAIGHEVEPETNEFKAVDDLRLPHCMSASGASLTMTAIDLLKFSIMHLNEGDGFLTPESIKAMQTANDHVPPNNSPLLLGWATLETNKTPLIVASGATPGQNAFICFLPGEEFALSILANTQMGGMQLFMALALPLLEDLTGAKANMPQGIVPPDLDISQTAISETDAAPYTGTFTNKTHYAVSHQNGELKFDISAKSTTNDDVVRESGTLIPLGDHRFAYLKDGTQTAELGLEFLFLESDSAPATHISAMNRIFARLT